MINSYERSDIIHIMKMNHFALTDSDRAHLTFAGNVQEKQYTVSILVVDIEPQVTVKQDKLKIYSETLKSVDDLKIFLEERLYQYLGKDN
jgi:hypothetical protein